MRRIQIVLWCIVLALLLGAKPVQSEGLSELGIVVSPENPTKLDTLEVTITAGCCRMPVTILDTAFEVSEGLIKIVTDRECGPFTMATTYTHTVIVPPVEPDSYIIEYWVTGDCLIDPNPILTSEIIVSQAVPAVRAWLLGLLLLILGVILLQRKLRESRA